MSFFRLLSWLPVPLLAACQAAVVAIGPVDLPTPVLVGPVLTLGGRPAVAPPGGVAFSGGAVAVPVEPQRPTGNEPPDRNLTEHLGVRSDLAQELARALGGRTGQALYVSRIRVVDTAHWTAIFLLDKQLQAEGYAFPAATAGGGGER